MTLEPVSLGTIYNMVINTSLFLFGGVVLWKIQNRMTKIDKRTEKRDACLAERDEIILDSISASLTLGMVTGQAVKEGVCNGNMTNAIVEAGKVQERRIEFMQKTAVEALRGA